MNKFAFIILSMLIIFSFNQCLAQESNNGAQVLTSTDESENAKDTKEKKEKKKDKDTIEISEKFVWSLIVNEATVLLILLIVYYPKTRQLETIFTFIMFNLLIFMLTFVLNKIKISMGAAFGLFAVFSMLRYRTEGISMKDMTYLFIFISVGLISAIQLDYEVLLVINGIILLFTLVLDSNRILKHELSKRIEYENIDLIKPENRHQLIDDLKNRTGLNIRRLTIEKIDFLKDSAIIRIFYIE